jgi:hypothetical protein
MSNQFFLRKTDHCTRCHKPFSKDDTSLMVGERVAYTVLTDGSNYLGITGSAIVPVCSECITVKESINLTANAIICEGCGRRMRGPTDWQGYCSPRCAARVRRRKRRFKQSVCVGCGASFRAARTDAKFCSCACRQRGYRIRSGTVP